MIGYINLGILLITLGFVIGVYVHTDKKIEKLSNEIKDVDNKLSNEIKAVDNKLSDKIDSNSKTLTDRIDKLSDRMDRLYDILVHIGFKDKAGNE